MSSAALDWTSIRAAYQAGEGSQRELAERFGVPYPTLRDRARAEQWLKGRDRVRDETAAGVQKALVKVRVKQTLDNLQVLDRVIEACMDKIDDPDTRLEAKSFEGVVASLVRAVTLRAALTGETETETTTGLQLQIVTAANVQVIDRGGA